ncbi:putative 3Fe-4S ferredoxin [Gordonia paraffinivorans NBRC 108238]|uniref:Ferredoxin n=2 Tax=Gordonia TaxID=2053 RepID=A0ABQ0IMJ2_9ACTN|nr:ferredoxin [Gordonia paraffinivorans]GAC84618.1 putative 3Fe-4S ferredoxin [Gordonia paraffinivorans NBRC 108238]
MRISVDMDKCTALGNCEAMAPDFFEVGDDGELELLRSDVGADELAEVKQAIASCPTAALKLIDG